MSWNEYYIMFAGFALGATLIKTILSKDKPPRLTSGGQFLILCGLFVAMGTLKELSWWSMIGIAFNAVMWLIIFIQKWR